MNSRRIFSIEEANRLLPQLAVILARLLEKKEAHERQHDEFFMNQLLQEATQKQLDSALDELLDRHANSVDGGVSDLEEEIEKIKSLGCILRNLERLWVEFPAERQGEPVYFCWKFGESSVQYYRPVQNKNLERFPLE